MRTANIEQSFEKYGWEQGKEKWNKPDAKIRYSEGFLIERCLSEFEC